MTDESEARCRFCIDASDIGAEVLTRARQHAENVGATRLTSRKHTTEFRRIFPDTVTSAARSLAFADGFRRFRLGRRGFSSSHCTLLGGAADVGDYSAVSKRMTASL